MPLPLDHPTPERAHRVYVALTNHCNRSCPWCITCSSPRGRTFLTQEQFLAALPPEGPFQLQLEGGEPTVHPQFHEFVRLAREHPRCERLVVCTNGAVLPRRKERLRAWLEEPGAPLTVKISVNHHLLDHDPRLLDLCLSLRAVLRELGGDRQLVVNVRRRRGYDDDDRRVYDAVEAAGLLPDANVFFLQAYGFAKDAPDWESPRLAGDRFTLVNPDGTVFGPDLVARSEGMRVLP